MNVEFQEKKTILSANIDVKAGSFALDRSPLAFETCRERFAAVFGPETEGFYFKHEVGQGTNVAAFVLKTETIVNAEHSKFSETNRDTILWVGPSKFWVDCPLRRSLLTIILRAGMLYDLNRDNYEEALFSQEYVIPTKKAVMRFLFGFTTFKGFMSIGTSTLQTHGWKMVFEGKSDLELKRLLVKPHGKSKSTSEELQAALWL